MALSNKERQELKDTGHVYDRQLGRWMHHTEQREYYRKKEESERAALWIAYATVGAIFIWMFLAILQQ